MAPRPPFTFSNSSIVRARALISFCCTIIFQFLMFILLINCPFDDAKVRRFWEIGKYFAVF